jgi:metal iron transporter
MCVKLGSVTGLDLAQMNHQHLPRWLELSIYAFSETAIICTDLSQVIGTAIAINILNNNIPTWGGCIISVVDTLLILLVYTPKGELRRVRVFEVFVGALVITIFVTICVTLSMVSEPARDVFLGFIPSKAIFSGTGLYESCAMLGGILMPHSLYVGSSMTRSRLYDYDTKSGQAGDATPDSSSQSYRPSVRAIKACMSYSIAELVFTLFTVGLFVNAALVIISGSAFYNSADSDTAINGDLPGLYSIFVKDVAPAAGTLFAISLLFSGMSAGIVATMAGQIVMEAAINIRLSPFLRRLVTRCIAIIPALIIAVSTGEAGLAQALVACNYILALALIVITAPLLYYPCRNKYMTIVDGPTVTSFKNTLPNSIASGLVWLLVLFMNVATIVLLALNLNN